MFLTARSISRIVNTLHFEGRIIPIIPASSRTIRTRPRAGYSSDPLLRDEKLLKKLEDQLERVKAKVKRDEEETVKEMKRAQHHGAPGGEAEDGTLGNHNLYVWNNVLSAGDRRELARNGIHSLNDLYETYRIAETAITRSPFTPLEKLDSRLQLAHNMYSSIPAKIADATRAARPPGGWW